MQYYIARTIYQNNYFKKSHGLSLIVKVINLNQRIQFKNIQCKYIFQYFI